MSGGNEATHLERSARGSARSARRTDYLEGIRGIAAVYVAINHLVGAYLGDLARLPSSPLWIRESRYLFFGRLSVAAFIVLSGYLLARPIAQRDHVTLQLLPYLRRRIRRIVPPYWAALLLSLLAIAVAPVLQTNETPGWLSAVPVTRGGIVSHLLLLHNLRGKWLYQIDPPMWSVATEFQIYFFLPLLLVPIWRRFGVFPAAAVGVVLGIAPVFFLQDVRFSPWFLALFSMGMAASSVNFSDSPRMAALEKDSRWVPYTGLAGLGVLSMLIYQKETGTEFPWVVGEVIFGGWMAAFLVVLSRSQSEGGFAARIVDLLASRPMVWLGSFSYSIYLVHQPVVSFVSGVVHARSLSMQVALSLSVGVSCMLAIAYLFHLAFERPFMRGSGRSATVGPESRRGPN